MCTQSSHFPSGIKMGWSKNSYIINDKWRMAAQACNGLFHRTFLGGAVCARRVRGIPQEWGPKVHSRYRLLGNTCYNYFFIHLWIFFVVSKHAYSFCTSIIMFFFLQSLLMDPLLNHFEHKDCFREASVGFRLENAGFVSSLTYLKFWSFLIALSSSFKPPVVWIFVSNWSARFTFHALCQLNIRKLCGS